MTEMQIEYKTEDEEGIEMQMRGVYPVFFCREDKTPRLFLATEDAETFTLSLYFNGRLKTVVYPRLAKDIIIRSLQSCNGLKALVELAELNREQAGRNKVN